MKVEKKGRKTSKLKESKEAMTTKGNISPLFGSSSKEHHCDDGGNLNSSHILDNILMINFLRMKNIL